MVRYVYMILWYDSRVLYVLPMPDNAIFLEQFSLVSHWHSWDLVGFEPWTTSGHGQMRDMNHMKCRMLLRLQQVLRNPQRSAGLPILQTGKMTTGDSQVLQASPRRYLHRLHFHRLNIYTTRSIARLHRLQPQPLRVEQWGLKLFPVLSSLKWCHRDQRLNLKSFLHVN